MTRPAESSSGPPELPGLTAASVWITSEIEKPLGAWIWRCLAETMPLVTVRSRPKGLPIATTGSPTSVLSESPSSSAVRSFDSSTSRRATSEEGSAPTSSASRCSPSSPTSTVISFGALDHVGVGEDVALVVDDEAGAARRALRGRCPDEGDAGGVALVDLADGELVARAALAALGLVADEARLRGGGRIRRSRSAVVADPAGLDGSEADDGDDQAAGDGGPEMGGENALHRGASSPRPLNRP